MNSSTPTPVMAQFLAIKAEHPDMLLFYRMGDFYEMFFEDALTAAPVLEIALTQRGTFNGQPIPMAGVPYHAARGYLAKLVQGGYKVAICEQMEPPGKNRGPLRREVVRVVTAGTLTEEDLLPPRANNFLVAIAPDSGRGKGGGHPGLAAIDLSTGQFQTTALASWDHLAAELSFLEPAELILPKGWEPAAEIRGWIPRSSRRDPWEFDPIQGAELLKEHFQVVSLAGFGIEESAVCHAACGALLRYCRETQKGALAHVTNLVRTYPDQALILDDISRRNLEVNASLRDGNRKTSLLGVLDLSVTSLGGRLLFQWLNRPLANVAEIQTRQHAVAWLLCNSTQRGRIRELLRGVHDLERLISRIALGRASPRDLGHLRDSIARLPQLAAELAYMDRPEDEIPSLLVILKQSLGRHDDLLERLTATLAEELPILLRDGDTIRTGYNQRLDELRVMARDSRQYIRDLELKERDATGITSLKTGYHRTFGYYIEVTNSQREKVPYTYQHKQTMATAVRYVTPELKELEERLLNAQDEMVVLEEELFTILVQETALHAAQMQQSAAAIACLDVLAAFAEVAERRDYCRPTMDDSEALDISMGRHPVVETFSSERFVPNDIHLDTEDRRLILITGPNMAGKSTFMRQVALMTLMAHAGCFVPAASARIGLVDRIFTRIGAADDLAGGRSTFMVEMTETAHILRHATQRSLVILDEVGRGTSTFDGLAIAWAAVEHIHAICRSRTLFATHYLELTELERQKPGIVNYTVEVKEYKETILFLHTIVPGAADRSYGVHVAQLAGLPAAVIARAKEVLAQLEEEELKGPVVRNRKVGRERTLERYGQLTLFSDPPVSPVLQELQAINPDDLSPKQALELVYRLRALL